MLHQAHIYIYIYMYTYTQGKAESVCLNALLWTTNKQRCPWSGSFWSCTQKSLLREALSFWLERTGSKHLQWTVVKVKWTTQCLPCTPLGTIHYCSREVSSHAHWNQWVEFHQVLQNSDIKRYRNDSLILDASQAKYINCLQWLGNKFKWVHLKTC